MDQIEDLIDIEVVAYLLDLLRGHEEWSAASATRDRLPPKTGSSLSVCLSSSEATWRLLAKNVKR